MILEEETFEKFGYYPSDLTPKSCKRVLAACDGCGKIRTTCKDIYRSHCRSCSRKGEKHYNWGKHPSEETKKKLRTARHHRHLPTHHTKPELIFEEICKKHNFPFKYTGDGSFWIGKKPSVNPDFIDCNGKKIAIEIFGDYWHSPLLRQNIPYSQTYKGRKKALKKYGWKLIMFWETDLLRKDAESFILSQLNKP